MKPIPALDSRSATSTSLSDSLSVADSSVSQRDHLKAPDVLDTPTLSRLCPSSRPQSAPRRSSSECDPGERHPRHHRFHPLRMALRVVADFFIVLWAVITLIVNWPQEWASIKDFLFTVLIFVLWVLHHLGIALALAATR